MVTSLEEHKARAFEFVANIAVTFIIQRELYRAAVIIPRHFVTWLYVFYVRILLLEEFPEYITICAAIFNCEPNSLACKDICGEFCMQPIISPTVITIVE